MLDEILIPVEDEMSQVEKILCEQLQSGVPLVTQAARYVTQNGGKRIRPAIFLLSAAIAGKKNERLPYLAAALELIHTASLLHDDVIDNSNLRRGKPSAKVKWGNHISILVGDFLWCKASEFFLNHGTDRLSKIVTKAITAITEGEILEITKLNDVTTDEHTYQKIIEGKTAALFGICGQGAAIIQELSGRFENALEDFGFNLGIAFQLTDDVLDYTSSDEKLGKESGADLKEGKLTLPVIISLKRCGQADKDLIRDASLTGQVTKGQFKDIVEIVHRNGGIEETSTLAKSYATKAKECLDVFKPSIERDALMGLADYAVLRRD